MKNFLCLLAIAIPCTAHGITHYGAHNPLSEAWRITSGDSGVQATVIAPDPQFPEVFAWQINGNTSGRLRYETAGPTPAQSWSYRAYLRMTNLNDALDAGTVMEVDNGARRFLLNFGSDADGATLIDVIDDAFPDQLDLRIAPSMAGRTNYIDVDMSFDAETGLADLYIDGVLRISGWSGVASVGARVNFGDGAALRAGVARFARVNFDIGPQACADGMDNNQDGLTDFANSDSQCQAKTDTTEGVYCEQWDDYDNDGLCEERLVFTEGDADPVLAGWRRTEQRPKQSYDPGDEDVGAGNCELPCAFWRVIDNGTAPGENGAYTINPAPVTLDNHWEARASVRLRPFTEGTAEAVSFASTTVVSVPQGSGTRDFGVRFGATATGDMLMAVNGSNEEINIGPVTDYKDIKVVFDPVSKTADYLVDGELVQENHPGRALTGTARRQMIFGSGSSADRARTHWASVALEMNPDSDNDGILNADEPALGTNPYAADSDDDGLEDSAELTAGTDPLDSDSDDDGLLDGFELSNDLNPNVADADGDLDGDGLINSEEQTSGTSAREADTDGDGLSDGLEQLTLETDPLLADTDGDGLEDGQELNVTGTDPLLADTDSDLADDASELSAGTDPLNPDGDNDGLLDGQEVEAGTDPFVADTDGDGMDDGFEVAYGFDPRVAGGGNDDDDGDGLVNAAENRAGTAPDRADSDGDGLSDGQEVNVARTDPTSNDTDGDGLLDAFEVASGFNPRRAGEAALDADNDGLSNLDEQQFALNPRVADTDGDGYQDGEETFIFGTLPTENNATATPLGLNTALEFVATDQPLFDTLPDPTFVDLAPLFRDQTGGTVRAGRVIDTKRLPSNITARDVWDEGVRQCDAVEVVAPISDFFPACRNLTVSPTRQECINGGRVNFNSRSITCCATLGVPNPADPISNGCSIFSTPTQFTIDDVNALPGGPYVTPTFVDVGSGFGPRPSANTPLPPVDYKLGAEVTQSTQVQGGITITSGLSSADPGDVDLYYETDAAVRVDNSVVAPGEAFTLELDHRPAPFRGPRFNGTESDCTAIRSGPMGSCMSSRWPAFLNRLSLDVSVDVNVDAKIYSINPENGEQLIQNENLFNETIGRSYELSAFDWKIGDSLDMRLLSGVPGVPDALQADISIDTDDVLGLWNPGTRLPLPIDIPFGCFLEKISPSLCVRFKLPATKPFSTNLMQFQLQIPELNSPVSLPNPAELETGFLGGAPSNFSLERVEPLRHALNEQGQLINTVPNKFRPTLNLDGLDGTAEGLIDTFIRNNTNLSSDVFRYELDVDGIICINSAGTACLGATVGIPLIANISVDAIDFDLVMWTGWDSTLTFDPKLQARLRFSRPVDVWDADAETYIGVAANTPYVVDVPADGVSEVQVLQIEDGVDVSVEYSFDNNEFTSESQFAIKLAAETSFLQTQVGGFLGALYQSIVGVPWRVGVLNVITEAPPVPTENISSVYSMSSGQTTFAGPTLSIVDARQDRDRDGIKNDVEATACSNENDADTDNDGLPDGIEDLNANGRVDPGETDPCNPDSDGDGLQDGRERGLVTPHPDTDLTVFEGNPEPLLRTDPNNSDSDRDGISDLAEILAGTNPNDASDPQAGEGPDSDEEIRGLNIILIKAAIDARRSP